VARAVIDQTMWTIGTLLGDTVTQLLPEAHFAWNPVLDIVLVEGRNDVVGQPVNEAYKWALAMGPSRLTHWVERLTHR